MDNFVNAFTSGFAGGLWSVIKAILLLIVAFIVAAIVRALVVKLLNKTGLPQKLGADAHKFSDYIGKLVYLLTFLLFVPGIFSTLNLNGISTPVLELLNKIWGFVPSLLAAVIVLIVGSLIARLVRQLLIPLFNKIKLDKLQEKAGIEVPDSARLSNTLAYIVYVLILIPVVITALQVLNIRAISEPAVNMLNTIIAFIPNLVIGLLVIVIGVMIASFACQLVTRVIATAGLDKKLNDVTENKFEKTPLSKIIGTVVEVVIIIFFVVQGLNILKLDVLTKIGSAIVAYMPAVLASVIILIACIVAAELAGKALGKFGKTYAAIAKAAIFTIGGFMILNQLGIAHTIVNTAFVMIIAALAVAFAVAFGIGGRDFASRTLQRIEDKVASEAAKDEEAAEEAEEAE